MARAAKHSKAVVGEPVEASPNAAPVAATAGVAVAFEPVVAEPVVDEIVVHETVTAGGAAASKEEIAKLAYSYWVERGYQDGNPQEDWARAEQALLA